MTNPAFLVRGVRGLKHQDGLEGEKNAELRDGRISQFRSVFRG